MTRIAKRRIDARRILRCLFAARPARAVSGMFRPLARAAGALFPGRFRIAGTMLALYVAVSFLTRLGLAALNSDPE
ncbi:MAG: hypothetical protein ACK6DI_05630, partial [Betaproteobacteria bacterium]